MKKSNKDDIQIRCSYTKLADITELIANPRNPNKHGDKQIALLAKIIRHQGWRSPVVVSKRSGFIVAGHGRMEAAKLLGVQTVPVDYQDFATEADEWAHLLADNRLAELSDTDGALLKDLIIDIDSSAQEFDMDLSGFDAEELDRVINFYQEDTKLTKMEILQPPKMAWVLIACPVTRFGPVSEMLERLAAFPEIKMETTTSDKEN